MLDTTTSTITYNGNDVIVSFDYPFKIFAETEMEVWLTDAAGAETLIDPSNYTVSGVGDDTGGSVNYPVAGYPVASGEKLTLRRILTVAQDFFDPANNQAFQAEVLETSADKTVAMIQQVKTDGDRSLRGSLTSDIDPVLPTPQAGKVLAWNDDEDALVNLATGVLVVGEGDIGTTELGDAAVTTIKVGDNQITADKIEDTDAIDTTAKLKDDIVTTAKLKDDIVTQVKLSGTARGVLVSSNDTTMGYLNGKLVAGDNIVLTETNDGADEILTISADDSILHSDFSNNDVTGTTLETDLIAFTIPANTVSAGNIIRIKAFIEAFTLVGNATIKFHLDGVEDAGFSYNLSDAADELFFEVDICIVSTSSQRRIGKVIGLDSTVEIAERIKFMSYSADMTSSIIVKFTCELSNSGDTIRSRTFSVELIK